MDEEEYVVWECPNCGDENMDPVHEETCCGGCGLIVFVLGEDEVDTDTPMRFVTKTIL